MYWNVPTGMLEWVPSESYGPWAVFFEKGSFETEFFEEPQTLTEYLESIPKDVSYWVQDITTGEVVWRQYRYLTPIQRSYESSQKNSQSMPHGRKTFYELVQDEMRPSAQRRPDRKGRVY